MCSLPLSPSWEVAEPGCKSRFVTSKTTDLCFLLFSWPLPRLPQEPHSFPALPNPLRRLRSLLRVFEPLFSATLSQQKAPEQKTGTMVFCSPSPFLGSLSHAAFSSSCQKQAERLALYFI